MLMFKNAKQPTLREILTAVSEECWVIMSSVAAPDVSWNRLAQFMFWYGDGKFNPHSPSNHSEDPSPSLLKGHLTALR